MGYGDIGDDIVLSDYELSGLSEGALGDELDDDLDGVGAYLELSDDQLDGIIGDLGKKAKVRKKAKIAKKVKAVARSKGVAPRRVLKAAKKKALKMSQGQIVCAPQPTCAGLTAVRQVIYDTETLSATQAAGDIAYFSVIRGQTTTTSGSSVTKAEYHTNMTASKSLPNPQMFDLEGLSMCVNSTNGPTVRQLGNLRANCSVVFYLGNTPYITVQLADIPMYSPLQGSFDGATTVPSSVGWIAGARESLDLTTYRDGKWSPQRINALEVFWLNLKINSALSMATNVDLVFRLHGTLYREIR